MRFLVFNGKTHGQTLHTIGWVAFMRIGFIGAGQMARVDSSQIAVWKAGEAKLSLTGSIIASDAFFPFRDGAYVGITQGVGAILQAGGSMRDFETIEACNEAEPKNVRPCWFFIGTQSVDRVRYPVLRSHSASKRTSW